MVCPNPGFTEQLELWGKCQFDFQNRSIVDQGLDADPVDPSCTTEGKEGDKEGGEEAKLEAPTIRREAFRKERGQVATTTHEEVVKKEGGQESKQEASTICEGVRKDEGEQDAKQVEKQEATTIHEETIKQEDKEGTETKAAIKRSKFQENANGDEEKKSKEKDESPEEDSGKGDKQPEALQNCENNPPADDSDLDSPSSMIFKGQKPRNVDDDTAANDNIVDKKDISALDLPTPPPTPPPTLTPAPELIRAAIKPLYSKNPAMGKKKLLRILNAQQDWSIGSKEFRWHVEAVIAGWSPKEAMMGT